jgi:LacI family transcriptional regulator
MVLDACATLGWKVPGDVAVVGVDDDPTVAPFAVPPLSSVARNDRRLGRSAAELLDRLIERQTRPPTPLLAIPPEGVTARRSTDTLAVDDPEVAAMVAHVRDHIGEPFGVERLLALSRLSRRRLELRFRRAAGCSPYALINRMRVDHARRLLADPVRRTLTSVAAACGFGGLRRFRIVFRRLAGVSPAALRRAARTGADAAAEPPHAPTPL